MPKEVRTGDRAAKRRSPYRRPQSVATSPEPEPESGPMNSLPYTEEDSVSGQNFLRLYFTALQFRECQVSLVESPYRELAVVSSDVWLLTLGKSLASPVSASTANKLDFVYMF